MPNKKRQPGWLGGPQCCELRISLIFHKGCGDLPTILDTHFYKRPIFERDASKRISSEAMRGR
jgi:hypothetical protein